MRQTWVDPRLAFGDHLNVHRVTLDTTVFDRIWTPDIYFPNEKKANHHSITVPNRLIRVYKNGTVYFSAR